MILLREKISNKFRQMLQHPNIPKKFYCDKCGLIVLDKKTADMIEEQLTIYICQCKNKAKKGININYDTT